MEINSLAELLSASAEERADHDSIDVDRVAPSRAPLHPGSIGSTAPSSSSNQEKVSKTSSRSKEIWEDHEILDHVEDDVDDGLECPR